MPADSGAGLWDQEALTFDDEVDHGLTTPQARSAWRDLLTASLPPNPARLADLGCGTASLTELLANEGYAVDGVDFSPAMVERALAKTAALPGVSITLGDAADPPLEPGRYDAVLCRHVLWALPDPSASLRRWCDLLTPGGALLLVEGNWSTGAGLTADAASALVAEVRDHHDVTVLSDPNLWGRSITDERYLLVSRS